MQTRLSPKFRLPQLGHAQSLLGHWLQLQRLRHKRFKLPHWTQHQPSISWRLCGARPEQPAREQRSVCRLLRLPHLSHVHAPRRSTGGEGDVSRSKSAAARSRALCVMRRRWAEDSGRSSPTQASVSMMSSAMSSLLPLSLPTLAAWPSSTLLLLLLRLPGPHFARGRRIGGTLPRGLRFAVGDRDLCCGDCGRGTVGMKTLK